MSRISNAVHAWLVRSYTIAVQASMSIRIGTSAIGSARMGKVPDLSDSSRYGDLFLWTQSR